MKEEKVIDNVVKEEIEKRGLKDRIKDFILSQPLTTALLSMGLFAGGLYTGSRLLLPKEKSDNLYQLALIGASSLMCALLMNYSEKRINDRYDNYKSIVRPISPEESEKRYDRILYNTWKKFIEIDGIPIDDSGLLGCYLKDQRHRRAIENVIKEKGLETEFNQAYQGFLKECEQFSSIN